MPRWGDDPTGPWSSAFVHKVVTSRAVLGEYLPRRRVIEKRADGRTVKRRVPDGEPIPNYYPSVISPAEWQAAQDSLRSRHRGTGKTVSKHWNPFAGWLLDARDGGVMYRKAETRTRDSIVNHAAAKGAPDSVYLSFPADQFITAILSQLREIDPAGATSAGPGDDRAAALADRRERLLARIGALRSELETGDGEVKAAVEALRKLEGQLEDVTADLARARAEAPERTAETWAQARSLIDLQANSPDVEDTRVRLKSALRRTVKEGRVLIVARTAQERKDGRGSVKPRHRLAAVQLWFNTGSVRCV